MISLGLFPFPTKNGVFPQHSPHLDSPMYSSPRPSCPATSEFGPSPAIRLSWHAITSNDKHVAPSQHVYLSHIPGRHLTSATPPVATPAGLSGEPLLLWFDNRHTQSGPVMPGHAATRTSLTRSVAPYTDPFQSGITEDLQRVVDTLSAR